MLLLLCISFLTMHDVSVQHVDADLEEISFVISDYTLSEYSHEQSASRPTNISVPSFVRTGSAGRHSSNSSGSTLAGLKSENQSVSWLVALRYLNTSLLAAGFSDSRSILLSLCRLLI